MNKEEANKIQIGGTGKGSYTACTIRDSWVEFEILRPSVPPISRFVLSRKEALNMAILLPEVKALFQWAKDAREHVPEVGLSLLEVVADEIFEPFEKGEKDE